MPQLQAVGGVVHLPDRGDLLDVELIVPIGPLGIGRQLRDGEVVQEGLHHIDGPLLVGHLPHGLQRVGRELGEDLRGEEASVPGQALGNGLRGQLFHSFVSCAYIVHTSFTTLIILSKKMACTSSSL